MLRREGGEAREGDQNGFEWLCCKVGFKARKKKALNLKKLAHPKYSNF